VRKAVLDAMKQGHELRAGSLLGRLAVAGTWLWLASLAVAQDTDLESVLADLSRFGDREDAEARYRALHRLRAMDRLPDAAIPALIDSLVHPDEMRATCIELLVRERRRAGPALVRQVEIATGPGKKSYRVAQAQKLEQVLLVLRQCGVDYLRAAPVRELALENDAPLVIRVQATLAWAQIAEDRAWEAELLARLQDAARVRDIPAMADAARGIAELKIAPETAVRGIVDAIRVDAELLNDISHGGHTAMRLALLGYGDGAVRELVAMLGDQVRSEAAAVALAMFGDAGRDAALAVLHDDDRLLARIGAVRTLGLMPRSGKPARLALEKLIGTANGELLLAALASHWLIFGSTEAIEPGYLRALADRNPSVVVQAAHQLAKLRRHATFGLAKLKVLEQHDNPEVRQAARDAVEAIQD